MPKMWVSKVSGVVPNIGYHVRWHGLWLEQVPGINMENMLSGQGTMDPQKLEDLWKNQIDKDQVSKHVVCLTLSISIDNRATDACSFCTP